MMKKFWFILFFPLICQAQSIIVNPHNPGMVIVSRGSIVTANVYTNPYANYDTTSLVAYFNFDGNVKDTSGNGYDGTETGIRYVSDWHDNLAHAVKFEGTTSSYIQNNGLGANLMVNQPLSIIFFVVQDSANNGTVFTWENGSSSERGVVGVNANGFRSDILTGGVTHFLSKTNCLTYGEEAMIVFTWDGSTSKLYVNKVLQTGTGTSSPSQNLLANSGYFGKDHTFTNVNFNGSLDEAFFYQRIIRSGEIDSFYLRHQYEAYPSFTSYSDTALFTRNTEINNQNTINAIHTLFNTLTDSGIYSKTIAIYPIAGDNSWSHRFNLQRAINDTEDYALKYLTTNQPTHDSNGWKGSNIGNTYLNANTLFTANGGIHITVVNHGDGINGYGSFGTSLSSSSNFWGGSGIINGSDSLFGGKFGSTMIGIPQTYNNTRGIWDFNINTSDSTWTQYCDGIKVFQYKLSTITTPSNYMYLKGYNDNGTARATLTYLTGASFGKPLTDDQTYAQAKAWRQYEASLYRSDTIAGRLETKPAFSTYPIPVDSLPSDMSPDTTHGYWSIYDTVKGCAIDFNMPNYVNNTSSFYTPSPWKMIDTLHVWEIFDSLKAIGISYVRVTYRWYQGFQLGNNTIAPPEYFKNSAKPYNPYDMRLTRIADTGLMTRIVQAARAHNMKLGIYINLVRDHNLFPGVDFVYQSLTLAQFPYWENYNEAIIQFVKKTYDPDNDLIIDFFFDSWKLSTPNASGKNYTDSLVNGDISYTYDRQGIYNAVKAIDSLCLVTTNNWADTTGLREPFDISSNEEEVVTFVGVTYKQVIPDKYRYKGHIYRGEVVTSLGTSNSSGGLPATQWEPTGTTGPDYIRSTASLQANCDSAIAVGAKWIPFFVVGRNGQIEQAQYDSVKAVVGATVGGIKVW